MKKTILAILIVLVVVALALAINPTTRDEIHWRWASHKDVMPSYEFYLKAWPDGRHVAEARARYDERGWVDAEKSNTIRSYRDYVETHPQGRFVQQAETRASALRNDPTFYEAALRAGTDASLKEFLADFPGHEKEAQAQQAIKDISEGRDIFSLLNEKKIEIEAQGNGIQNVSVRFRRLVSYPITVCVPIGSYFISARQSAQNMVTTTEIKVHLITDDWKSVSVPAACANRPRDIPGSGDTFTVQRSPHQQELARLMPVLDKAGVPYDVRQAAVWIVTDNADYDDMGILVSRSGVFSSKVIGEEDAARAMQICEEAGIDIKRKAIWKDRQRILYGLKAGELKTWLDQKK
jgi:hypothetical protein